MQLGLLVVACIFVKMPVSGRIFVEIKPAVFIPRGAVRFGPGFDHLMKAQHCAGGHIGDLLPGFVIRAAHVFDGVDFDLVLRSRGLVWGNNSGWHAENVFSGRTTAGFGELLDLIKNLLGAGDFSAGGGLFKWVTRNPRVTVSMPPRTAIDFDVVPLRERGVVISDPVQIYEGFPVGAFLDSEGKKFWFCSMA